jgi:hypothetical protein
LYPQTHVFFAENVLEQQRDTVTLGSIFPDMLVGRGFTHFEAHSKGMEIFEFLKTNDFLSDFGRAVLTHGFNPKGLDYYGDEKYLDFEKGYCFEKARPFISETVEACNIPVEMGWWKAHNIIEMGVELLISAAGNFGEKIAGAFSNKHLIKEVNTVLYHLWPEKMSINLERRVEKFSGMIALEKTTPEILARKYRIQMQLRHRVDIDTQKVARLIDRAAEEVDRDMPSFFSTVAVLVKENLK